jgi:hypothetical protein
MVCWIPEETNQELEMGPSISVAGYNPHKSHPLVLLDDSITWPKDRKQMTVLCLEKATHLAC